MFCQAGVADAWPRVRPGAFLSAPLTHAHPRGAHATRAFARAVAAARPGPRCVTFDLTSDHHAEMYFVLTQALEDFAARERDQAAWEEGNSSRERWADLADAMRAQVEIARDGAR
jgi:hypothetical protein